MKKLLTIRCKNILPNNVKKWLTFAELRSQPARYSRNLSGRRTDAALQTISARIRSHPLAVGRKNWLFSSSVDGANASAVIYTMVEMAKVHGLNIYGYLKFLLEHRPSEDMTDEQMAELAPWGEKLQSIKISM